jgi:hypothetical protein
VTTVPVQHRLGAPRDVVWATVQFRVAPPHLHAWLRRIDRWIAYANSIVEE